MKTEHHTDYISTSEFGHALHFDRVKTRIPVTAPEQIMWRIIFDTGIVIYSPLQLFETLSFSLDHADEPPSGAN